VRSQQQILSVIDWRDCQIDQQRRRNLSRLTFQRAWGGGVIATVAVAVNGPSGDGLAAGMSSKARFGVQWVRGSSPVGRCRWPSNRQRVQVCGLHHSACVDAHSGHLAALLVMRAKHERQWCALVRRDARPQCAHCGLYQLQLRRTVLRGRMTSVHNRNCWW
jgi:hypothetical protein